MSVRNVFCAIIALPLLLLSFLSSAQTEGFQSQWETSCLIRQDKFNYVLPEAMRRNGIDMWIVIDHGRGTEPMMLDLGIETA